MPTRFSALGGSARGGSGRFLRMQRKQKMTITVDHLEADHMHINISPLSWNAIKRVFLGKKMIQGNSQLDFFF